MVGRLERLYFDTAEQMYVKEGKSLTNIAQLLPEKVSVTTLGKWAAKGGWVAKQTAYQASHRDLAQELRELLKDQMAEIRANKGKLTPGDLDAIYKNLCAIDKIEKGACDLKVMAVEVMKEFTRWLREVAQAPVHELQLMRQRLGEFFNYLETR